MTDLSPAAQAVMDAFRAEWPDEALKQDCKCLAAALRALADQVVPEQLTIPDGDLTEQTYRWDERSGIHRKLLAIVTELKTNA
jgi:hypothetical protein